MSRTKVEMLLTMMLLSGCVDRTRSDQDQMERKSRAALDHLTNDPLAMQLRSLKHGKGNAICGEVNLNDRQGVFQGFQHFYVDASERLEPFLIRPAVFQLKGFQNAVNSCLSDKEKTKLNNDSDILTSEWKQKMDEKFRQANIELMEQQLRARELQEGY